ncbi:hypothetical protein K2Z84_30765 [Candidatus Binatia bacterium]|nr:hypothetical protein [Candidatus Binatia bacterium]
MAEHGDDDTTSPLERLPHATLAAVGREYLLFGHLVTPHARCRAVTPPQGARHAWEIVIDPAASLPAERPEVAIVAAANTARFVFRPGRTGT